MSIKKWLVAITGILFAVTLSACGSSIDTDSPEYSGTSGRVGILLKDSPPGPPFLLSQPDQPPPMSQLWVTVNRVALKMEEDEGLNGPGGTVNMEESEWLTVFEGVAVYDLLTLNGDKAALMALIPVPADKADYYEKARFEIDETPGKNCFYKLPAGMADDPSNPCTDSDASLLNVPSGKVDIEFHSPIHIGQGSTQYVVFDFLPADSVKVTTTGGRKTYLLKPEIHAYTIPSILETNGWSNISVDRLEGYVKNISGCDDPEMPDILTLSYNQDSMTIPIDITGVPVTIDGSDEPVACGSLEPGQEVEVKVHISGDGTMVAEKVEITEDSSLR